MKTLICIPCYNEEKRLPVQNFINFLTAHQKTHFLFVNDGSTDNTQELIQGLCQTNGDCFFSLNLAKNQGKAEAVRQGLLWTIGKGYEAVGYWDADLATPLDEIPRFVQILENKPSIRLVLGSRIKRLGATIERKATRHYLGRVFATLASNVLKLPVYDTQCGAKLFRYNSTFESIFSKPFATKWIFDVEIFARYLKSVTEQEGGTAFFELPLNTWKDIDGSKLRIKDFLRSAFDLWIIYRKYPTPKH